MLSIQTVEAGTDFDAVTPDAGRLLISPDSISSGEFVHVRSCRFHGNGGGATTWKLIAAHPTVGDNMVVLLAGTTEEDWTFEDFTLPVTEDGVPYLLGLLTVGLAVDGFWTIDFTVKCEGTQ